MTDHQLFQDFTFHNVEQLDGCRVPVRPLSAQAVLQEGSLFYNLTDNLPYVSTGTVWLPVLAGTSDVAADIAITAQDIALTADVDDITLTAADDIVLTAAAGTLDLNAQTVDIDASASSTMTGALASTINSGSASVVATSAGNTVTNTGTQIRSIATGAATDSILLSTAAGGVDIDTAAASGQITMFGRVITDLITASSGAAAVPTQSRIHQITTTGTGDALTLANGTAGQHLDLIYVAEGAGGDTAVLTPATLAGGTTITFNALGDTASLVYSATGGWYMTGGSAVIA